LIIVDNGDRLAIELIESVFFVAEQLQLNGLGSFGFGIVDGVDAHFRFGFTFEEGDAPRLGFFVPRPGTGVIAVVGARGDLRGPFLTQAGERWVPWGMN